MSDVDRLLNKPLVVNGRYQLAGEKFTRVTNFVKTVEDRYNLEKYFKRMVALGLAARPDLYATAASLTADDKKKLDEVAEQAIEAAKGSAKANLGSALHTFTERVDRGESLEIPAPWDADIAAYTAAIEANGVTIDVDLMERVVVHRRYRIAGRFDRVLSVAGHPLPYIADVKTGSLDFGLAEIAAQLYVYASADELYDEGADALSPMVAVDQHRAIIIHLPVGQARCDLLFVPLDIGKRVADLCRDVRELRRSKVVPTDLATPLVPGVAERVAWLAERISGLRDSHPAAFGDLLAAWPADCPTFKQGGHTVEHAEMIALALSTIEARHGVMFGDSDPADTHVDPAVVAALVARLKALPDDLLDAVKSAARTLGVPNVESERFRVAHLADVEPLIADAEQASVQRTSSDVQDNKEKAA